MPRKPAAAAQRRQAATTKKKLQKPIIEQQDRPPTPEPGASPVRPSRRTRTTRLPKPSPGLVMTTRSQSKPLLRPTPSLRDPALAASDDATAPSSISNPSAPHNKHPISTIAAFPASVKRPRLRRHRPATATLPNLGSSTAIAPTTLSPSSLSSIKSPSSCYSSTVRPRKSRPRKRPFPNKSHGDHASSSITHVNSEERAMAKLDISEEEKAMIMKIENAEQNGDSKSKKQLGSIVRGENGELVWSTYEVIYTQDKEAAGEPSVDKEASCNWHGDRHGSDDSNSDDDDDNDDTDNEDYDDDYYDNEDDGNNIYDSYDGDSNGGGWDSSRDDDDDDDDGDDDNSKSGNHEDDDDSSGEDSSDNQDGDDKNSRDEDGGKDDDNNKNGSDENGDKSRNDNSNDDSSDDEDGDGINSNDNDDKEEDKGAHYDDDSKLGSEDDDDSCSNNRGDADSRDDENGEDDDDTDGDGDARAHDDDNGDDESGGNASEEKELLNFFSSGDDEDDDVDVAGNSLNSNDNGDDSDSHGGASSDNNDSSDYEYGSDHNDENDKEENVSSADDVHSVTSPLKKHEGQQLYVYNPFEPRSPPDYDAPRPLIRSWRAANLVLPRLPSPTSPSDPSDQESISSYPNEPQYTENAHASSPSSRLHGPTLPSHNQGGSFAPTYAQYNHPESPTSRPHEIRGHTIHPVHAHHQNQNLIPSQLSHYTHERGTTGSENAWHDPYMLPRQHPDVPSTFYGLGGSNTDIMTGNTRDILDALNADTNGTSQREGFLRAAESDLQRTSNIGPSEREEQSPSTYPSSPRTARLSLDVLSPRVRLNDKRENGKRKSPPQL